MLNVSDAIKKSFLDSSLKKKLIIYGAGIIDNSNLISESFKFKESISSQKDFRFGSFEISEVNFSAINIGNITGKTIDVSMDIEVKDNLKTKEFGNPYLISVNLSNIVKEQGLYQFSCSIDKGQFTSFDIHFENGNTTTYNYKNTYYRGAFGIKPTSITFHMDSNPGAIITTSYVGIITEAITIGRFTVDSCKRDSSNMNIRNVVAYQKSNFDFSTPDHIIRKYGVGFANNASTKIDVAKYITACTENMGYFNVTRESLSFDTDTGIETERMNNYDVSVHYSYIDIYDFVYMMISSGKDPNRICDDISSGLLEGEKSYILNFINNRFKVSLEMARGGADEDILIGKSTSVSGYIDPYIVVGDESFRFRIKYPSSFDVYDVIEEKVIGSSSAYDNISIKKCKSDYFNKMILSLERKEKGNGLYYLDIDTLPNPKMLYEAYCELYGYFIRVGRDGNINKIHISEGLEFLYPSDDLFPDYIYPQSSAHETYDMSMYSRCYYDDYESTVFNGVVVDFIPIGSTDGIKKHIEYMISDFENGQYYNLNDNYIIQNCAIDQSLVGEFMPIIGSEVETIKYMPFNMDAVGLPYIEAGDRIQVLTADGGFTSIVMSRTLSGIQALRDTFEAN